MKGTTADSVVIYCAVFKEKRANKRPRSLCLATYEMFVSMLAST